MLRAWGRTLRLKHFNTTSVMWALVTRWPRLQPLTVIDVFCLALADRALGCDIQFLVSLHMLLSWFICPHEVKWSTKQWDAGLVCTSTGRLFSATPWKCFLRLTWSCGSVHLQNNLLTSFNWWWCFLKFNPHTNADPKEHKGNCGDAQQVPTCFPHIRREGHLQGETVLIQAQRICSSHYSWTNSDSRILFFCLKALSCIRMSIVIVGM